MTPTNLALTSRPRIRALFLALFLGGVAEPVFAEDTVAEPALAPLGVILSGPNGEHLPPGGQVRAWGGRNFNGELDVPAGLAGVVAVAAGGYHTAALKGDGTLVAWGYNALGQANVPAGLTGVIGIAAGAYHTVALKGDGTVLAWGGNHDGESVVPNGLRDVVAIAAGGTFTMALKSDGTVVTWGSSSRWPKAVPVGLSDVAAIAAGYNHAVALKADGTVVTWGYPVQTSAHPANDHLVVPKGLRHVVAVAAGLYHSVALKADGSVVAWGSNVPGTTLPSAFHDAVAIAANWNSTTAIKVDGNVVSTWGNPPNAVPHDLATGVVALASGGEHTVAVWDTGYFGQRPYRTISARRYTLRNTASAPARLRLSIAGEHSSDFLLYGGPIVRMTIAPGAEAIFYLRFTPLLGGPRTAALRIESDDPGASPLIVNLSGGCIHPAHRANAADPGADQFFTCSPAASDRLTGLALQSIFFRNYSPYPMPHGFKVRIRDLPPGVTPLGGQLGSVPGETEVLYTLPVPPHGTASFPLSFAAPSRWVSPKIEPTLLAEPLPDAVPTPAPLTNGTAVPTVTVRDTAQGPLLQWAAVPGATYVVEYSSDKVSWFSAVHRLKAVGVWMTWIDRGQPETQTKPANKAARSYRVRKL